MEVLVNPDSQLALISSYEFEKKFGSHGSIYATVPTRTLHYKGIQIPCMAAGGLGHLMALRAEVLSGSQASASTAHNRKQPISALASSASKDYAFVHRLLCHVADKACDRTAAKAIGLPNLEKQHSGSGRKCQCCILSNTKATPKGQGLLSTGHRPTKPGQVFCADVFGPLRIKGFKGEKYFVVLTCQFSKMGDVRCMESLTEITTAMESMLVSLRARLQTPLKEAYKCTLTVHSDNASYFRGGPHVQRLAELNVTVTFSTPYVPDTNPFAERFGQTLMKMTRAMLLEGSFPPKFWSVLIRTAVWTLNRIVREDGTAPIETFSGETIDFTNVYPAGVLAFWPVPKRNRADPKLGDTAGAGVYLGPAAAFGARGHLCLNANNKLYTVSHVITDPDVKPFHAGLVKRLLSLTEVATSAYEQAQIDPKTLSMPAGLTAYDLIGARVTKLFDTGWFSGTVHSIIQPDSEDPTGSPIYFRVVYEDGDVEDLTYAELRPVLATNGQAPVAALQSLAPEAECDPFLDPEDLLPPFHPDEKTTSYMQDYYAIICTVSSALVHDRQAADTYNWSKVFKMSPHERAPPRQVYAS
jgi:transposase InsO family protein